MLREIIIVAILILATFVLGKINNDTKDNYK